jgi:hypothetical protein
MNRTVCTFGAMLLGPRAQGVDRCERHVHVDRQPFVGPLYGWGVGTLYAVIATFVSVGAVLFGLAVLGGESPEAVPAAG